MSLLRVNIAASMFQQQHLAAATIALFA